MILFFFLLLMLAMAWGVADHYQSLISRVPPPAPPAKIAAPAPPSPAILPPADATVSATDPANDPKSGDAVAPEASGKTDVDGGSAGKP